MFILYDSLPLKALEEQKFIVINASFTISYLNEDMCHPRKYLIILIPEIDIQAEH